MTLWSSRIAKRERPLKSVREAERSRPAGSPPQRFVAGELLEWPARVFPHRTAIVHGSNRITFREFDARINRLANALRELSFGENARVAVLVENSPQAVEIRFALM